MNKTCKNIGVFIGKVTQKVKTIRKKLPKQELDSFTDGSKMYEFDPEVQAYKKAIGKESEELRKKLFGKD